jgi:hypothetical protein
VSWAIRRFDESDVDRAAIVLRPETMAEATASGLRHVAIEPAVDGNAFTYVRRLTTGVAPSSVVERALTFSTDFPPTHDPTVLLALLAMTRKLPIAEPSLRRLLCVLLDRAAGRVYGVRARRRSLLLGSGFVLRFSIRRATLAPRSMCGSHQAPLRARALPRRRGCTGRGGAVGVGLDPPRRRAARVPLVGGAVGTVDRRVRPGRQPDGPHRPSLRPSDRSSGTSSSRRRESHDADR